jgi:hypothetical protein
MMSRFDAEHAAALEFGDASPDVLAAEEELECRGGEAVILFPGALDFRDADVRGAAQLPERASQNQLDDAHIDVRGDGLVDPFRETVDNKPNLRGGGGRRTLDWH